MATPKHRRVVEGRLAVVPDVFTITDVRFAPARPDLRRSGLRGWASCVLDERLQLDGLAVRLTADGRPVVSFPVRTDASGGTHPYYRALDEQTRDAIESQVIAEVRRRGYLR